MFGPSACHRGVPARDRGEGGFGRSSLEPATPIRVGKPVALPIVVAWEFACGRRGGYAFGARDDGGVIDEGTKFGVDPPWRLTVVSSRGRCR